MVEAAPGASRPTGYAAASTGGFVEWGAVFAGAVLAAAISFVLLGFGSVIGLSFVSPWGEGASAKTIASLAVFWAMAQQIGAFMVGGYIAGRMRTRWSGTAQHEAEFRDGLHGGLVWAVGIVIGAALLLATAGAVARTGAEVAGRAASAAAATATNNAELLSYEADVLLRPSTPGAAPRQGGTGAGQTTAASGSAEPRAEVARIFGRSILNGGLSNADRTYLAGLVAQRTGLSQQDAEKRVTDVYNDTTRATKEAADKARRAAILTGLVTAVSLLVSLGAAWWAAMRGGHHRDHSIPARFVVPHTTSRPAV
jgi:hypothetical protein